MANRSEIVAAAAEYDGIKWRHLGRTVTAVDCLGLVLLVGWDVGLIRRDVDVREYGRRPDGSMLSLFDVYMDRVPRGKHQPGDVLVFRESQFPCHVGIMTTKRGHRAFWHARASNRRVMCERLDEGSPSWSDRLVAAYSYPGVTDG